MKVEVIRGEVKPIVPPIKEVILQLSEEDAITLFAIANYPAAVSGVVYAGEYNARIEAFLNRLFTQLRLNNIGYIE